MFRFSRSNWLGRVSYRQFKDVAQNVARMATKNAPGLEIEVLTYERFTAAANYPKAAVMSDAAMQGGGQKSYPLDAFAEATWKKAEEVQLTIRDPSSETSFMICVSCFPGARSSTIDFYGQGVPEELFRRIYDTYARPALFISVSQGNRHDQSLIGAAI